MNNFELIDDYLANQLNEQEKISFEQQMAGDPALKEEVEFQQQVVEGVRSARSAELKAMLKNVPLNGNTWSGGKIAATAVSVGIVATSIYFYLQEEQPVTPPEEQRKEQVAAPKDKVEEPAVPATDTKQEPTNNAAEPAHEKSEAAGLKKVPTPVKKPDIQVVDPSAELTETEKATESVSPNRSEISPSKMEVITGISDKKHSFHYQCVESKLMLYGPFDKSLYEILEIHGDGHAVFLFYRENYYLLDEKESNITPLHPIRDSQLLKKLKEYRGR